MKLSRRNVEIVFHSTLVLFMLTACGERTVSTYERDASPRADSSKTAVLNLSGKLFGIPSPIQTAMLIRKSQAPYRKNLLSEISRASDYNSNVQQALNLGIYGTDMAYSNLYDDGQAALQAFKAVDHLSTTLGIKGSVNPGLIKRLASNIGNTDSLITLSGYFFSEADAYLKENERYDIAALIVAGGWVESTYLTAVEAAEGNTLAAERLAEQQLTAKVLTEALQRTTDGNFGKSAIFKALSELSAEWQNVERKYQYVQPQTIPDNKLTVIKSSTSHSIDAALISDIKSRIEALRNLIIQGS